jgi:hypothetical protein
MISSAANVSALLASAVDRSTPLGLVAVPTSVTEPVSAFDRPSKPLASTTCHR